MGSPGGYQINPGLYRVPDLLTEDQFINYMWVTYGVTIEFKREEGDKAPSPARALGQSRVMGPVAEDFDVEDTNPPEIRDPILRNLNERNFGPNYSSTVTPDDEKTDSEKDEMKDENRKTTSSASTSSTKTTSTSTKK